LFYQIKNCVSKEPYAFLTYTVNITLPEIHMKKGRSLSALFDLINLIKALDQTITVSGPFYLEQQSSSVSL
uniref:hypothetical protein n=1 Tax=Bacillus subtilis TaxID=1423 RepID=UPI003F87C82F